MISLGIEIRQSRRKSSIKRQHPIEKRNLMLFVVFKKKKKNERTLKQTIRKNQGKTTLEDEIG